MSISSINARATAALEASKKAAASDTGKKVAVGAAVVIGAPVALGVMHALYAKAANLTWSLIA